MSEDVRANALDDLLNAERSFRQQAERALRELRGVLVELAQRWAGSRLEDCRRGNPLIPENWGPEQWRRFFAELPGAPLGESWGKGVQEAIAQLQAENQRLKGQLATMEKAWLTERPPAGASLTATASEPAFANSPEVNPAPGDLPVSNQEIVTKSPWAGFVHAELLGDLRALALPRTLPVRFENCFPRTGLKDIDWLRQVRRKLFVLYLLSRGLDIRLEIDHLISQVEGISARTGALRRLYDVLVEKNLVTLAVLEMSAPNTSLAMLQLTGDGRELCNLLQWNLEESERQRLDRLHEGQLYPQHTLGVMIFAMHARLRGYQARVLPEVNHASTHAIPDVSILRPGSESDEPLQVEVEMSSKELPEKWRNLVQLQGKAALCARNIVRRARLVGDCKLKNLHGMATDLETLIAVKVPEISLETPLWVEEW